MGLAPATVVAPPEGRSTSSIRGSTIPTSPFIYSDIKRKGNEEKGKRVQKHGHGTGEEKEVVRYRREK